MRVLLIHPGASWSTADVEAGLRYGLEAHGVEVIRYRLDTRIERAQGWLNFAYRKAKKTNPTVPKPTWADVCYQAGRDALGVALREQVDAVLIVSAMLLHPDVIVLMKRAGLFVTILLTESPYDLDDELKVAGLVDGCWTNERTSVEPLKAINPHSGYVPHSWHPERHVVGPHPNDDEVPAHDVVFVGTGFSERISFFNAIDWTGIDLGLYGVWKDLGLKPELEASIRGREVSNLMTAALYRRAKIGLNLYRSLAGRGRTARRVWGESLNPRAYELAACGVFHCSEYRAEVREVFGDLVPTFRTPAEAAAIIRQWLPDEAGRQQIATALPASVAESSWVERASWMIGDLQTLLEGRSALRATG
jgi:spore maturation protein CgeB